MQGETELVIDIFILNKMYFFDFAGEKMMQRLPSVSQDDVPVMISKQKFISIVIANSKVSYSL